MSARTIPFVITALLATAACDRQDAHAREMRDALEDAGQDLDRAAESFRNYAYTKRTELSAEIQRRMDALDDDLARVKTRARELTGEAKTEAEALAARLDRQWEIAKGKLQRLGDASAEAWQEARDGAVEAWRTLEESVKDAGSKGR